MEQGPPIGSEPSAGADEKSMLCACVSRFGMRKQFYCSLEAGNDASHDPPKERAMFENAPQGKNGNAIAEIEVVTLDKHEEDGSFWIELLSRTVKTGEVTRYFAEGDDIDQPFVLKVKDVHRDVVTPMGSHERADIRRAIVAAVKGQ
jgi:hypothetical protein